MTKLIKSNNGNYVVAYGDAVGSKAIAKLNLPQKELREVREFVNRFYEGPYRSAALADLTPKKVLKYRNGAVVNELDYGTKYWYLIEERLVSYAEYTDHSLDRLRCQHKNIFITQEDAENALKRMQIYNKLEKKIIEINAENNWVADWRGRNQEKWVLVYDHEKQFYFIGNHTKLQASAHYMCEAAVRWLLSDEVTDEERMVWIEGI